MITVDALFDCEPIILRSLLKRGCSEHINQPDIYFYPIGLYEYKDMRQTALTSPFM